ncbi:GNAT family N-acetyltransferase [Brevibacillus dissolubilis]|uniref:GNAT family N-acetyltransferase n=1 Tax=Brevibacillus dissolubilis TaxID=1844116 RepID=UPI0011170C5A|nr:GNAT family N-acetyltransferase [Brevibacillus dissolubilis]
MSIHLQGTRITITEWSAADLTAALNVYNSNPAYNESIFGTPQLTCDALRSEYEKWRDMPTSHWLAIRLADEWIGVGHIAVVNPRDEKSWIGLLMIHGEHQRLGYGREAYHLIESHLRMLGRTSLNAGVTVSNSGALAFFGTMGFEQYRQVLAPVGKQVQPVMCMAKWLGE